MSVYRHDPKFLLVHPIDEYAREIAKLGMRLDIYENAPHWLNDPARGFIEVAVIDLHVVPVTNRTKELFIRLSGDPTCNGFHLTHTYELRADPEAAINEPRAVALQDAGVYALSEAHKLLREGAKP